MYFLGEGFTFRNFLIDVLTISIFVFWFWLVITVAADLFRRSDVSGWGKAGWVIGWVVFPFIAVLAYLIFQGKGMAERNAQRADQARDQLKRSIGFSAADEIEKLDRLKKRGRSATPNLLGYAPGSYSDPCQALLIVAISKARCASILTPLAGAIKFYQMTDVRDRDGFR